MKRKQLLIVGAIVIAAVLMFGGRGRAIGLLSSGGRSSALPGGYRSEAPNSPYLGSPVQ